MEKKDIPLARRRAHACRVSSRALSNPPPHRTHAYAPAPTAWMCRWKVSARTPLRSSSHPRLGQRSSPSVRELCSIASVASSLYRRQYPHTHISMSEMVQLREGGLGTYRHFELACDRGPSSNLGRRQSPCGSTLEYLSLALCCFVTC